MRDFLDDSAAAAATAVDDDAFYEIILEDERHCLRMNHLKRSSNE